MSEHDVDVKIGQVKSIRGVEPGDEIVVCEREATFLGEWEGFAHYALADEEPRTRKMREGNFREGLTFGKIEAL